MAVKRTRHWSNPQRVQSIRQSLEVDYPDPLTRHDLWALAASRRFPNSEWEGVRWALPWIKKGHAAPPGDHVLGGPRRGDRLFLGPLI